MTRGHVLGRGVGALAVLSVLTFAVVGSAYNYLTSSYCKRLESRARSPEVQRALESWVAVSWRGERVAPESVLSGDGIGPGFRWLAADFDDPLLAMGPTAHVRLLGVEAGDVLADAIAPNVEAIFFTERSRFGLLVQLPDREAFRPAAHQQLIPVSETVAVLCTE